MSGSEGDLDLVVRGLRVATVAMARVLAEEFIAAGGENFVHTVILGAPEEVGPLYLSVQRVEGKTPGELVQELKAELASAREEIARLKSEAQDTQGHSAPAPPAAPF